MKKKALPYAVFAIALIALMAFIIWSSSGIDLIISILPDKIATMKNVHMSGTEGSNEAWEIEAKEAWTGKEKMATTFENVTNARITKNGKLMIKDLQARRMKISKNKDIEIWKNVPDDKEPEPILFAQIDFNAISNKPKKEKKLATLTADNIKFNPDRKIAVMEGKIKIVKDGLVTTSEKMSLDLDRNIATFETRSTFSKKGSKLIADRAVAYFDDDRIDMFGSVEVSQKNKTARAPRASYDDDTKLIVLYDGASAVIEKLKNMIKPGTAEKYTDEESGETLQAKTNIICDKLEISDDNSDATAYGNVRVTQKEQEARSDKAVYSENTELIYMTGHVEIKKKDGWVKAEKVIVYVDKEKFEAIGNVETTFNVKKGKRSF
jgi:lipopolysaccharide export system protein LptA